MFQEALAEQTAEHFREHLEDLLDGIAQQFSGPNILTTKVPNVDSVTLVGGVMSAPIEQLPLIGVDCVEKRPTPSNESLYLYEYEGAFAGLASASTAQEADKLAKRYAAAVELFIREHELLHQITNDWFSVREFLYGGTGFSGSIEVQLEEQAPDLWIAGFTIPTLWVTSEDGPRQHAAS